MILGINGQNHDASMALINGSEILWAGHAERYSRVKNDSNLNSTMVQEMLEYGEPEQVVWFERPWSKNFRRLFAGQRPWQMNPMDEIRRLHLDHLPVEYVGHHQSHAAAGYYTSKFEDAAILVVDAIGEWDTVTIWEGRNNKLKRRWGKRYPNSIGLFYTAMTQYVGLKPNEEEYILMGMAAFGKPVLFDEMRETFFSHWNPPNFKLRYNLHQGCRGWQPRHAVSMFDIAASAQALIEEYLCMTVDWMSNEIDSDNLVFMGGVALNCVANSLLVENYYYENIHIMPNPGDAGSAIGAVVALTEQRLNWRGPYLGTDIQRDLDIDAVVKELLAGNVVAVANGRAEFGPRALGNRSLLCDPRGPSAKSRMNEIKKREQFRPFAPAILEEHAGKYFNMPVEYSPYMQLVAPCLRPNELPGICHEDGTSRVQTVGVNDNAQFRALLEAWHQASGCPVLMNTSLNIKGEPLVNTWQDAERFQQLHNIKIF